MSLPVNGCATPHELQRRDGLYRAVRSDHHVGQLARGVAADTLAVQDAALQVDEFRPNGHQNVAADAPAEVCFLAPARTGGYSGTGSGSSFSN